MRSSRGVFFIPLQSLRILIVPIGLGVTLTACTKAAPRWLRSPACCPEGDRAPRAPAPRRSTGRVRRACRLALYCLRDRRGKRRQARVGHPAPRRPSLVPCVDQRPGTSPAHTARTGTRNAWELGRTFSDGSRGVASNAPARPDAPEPRRGRLPECWLIYPFACRKPQRRAGNDPVRWGLGVAPHSLGPGPQVRGGGGGWLNSDPWVLGSIPRRPTRSI
jgi:hypothetical protein